MANIFKILVIGDIATGKTSIIKRYVYDKFFSNYKATVGVDFAVKSMERGNEKFTLQLWDIAGQERFGNMTAQYYRESVACVIVCEVRKYSTYNTVVKWKTDLEAKYKKIPTILLCNKIDKQDANFITNKNNDNERLDKICESLNIEKWFYTSAQTDYNLKQAFEYLVDKLVPSPSKSSSKDTIRLKNHKDDGYDGDDDDDDACRC